MFYFLVQFPCVNLFLAWLRSSLAYSAANFKLQVYIFANRQQKWCKNMQHNMHTFENHINFLQLGFKIISVFFNFIGEWTEMLRNDKIEQNGQSFRKFRKLTCWEREEGWLNKYYILENWNYSTKSKFKALKIKNSRRTWNGF